MNERMTEYMDSLTADMEVEGDLYFLEVEAKKALDAEEAEETTEESSEEVTEGASDNQ